ncbi:MAG TPA: hypothetical protein VFY89_06575 [Ktedonobacterales bacterium]
MTDIVGRKVVAGVGDPSRARRLRPLNRLSEWWAREYNQEYNQENASDEGSRVWALCNFNEQFYVLPVQHDQGGAPQGSGVTSNMHRYP